METSMCDPWPVCCRCSSAARMLEYAYMPAEMSAIEMPALHGSFGVPVTDSRPASLWIRRS
jgi:hypothetical protein